MSGRRRVGILGASGLVGQRFVHRLADHPMFELAGLAGGPRTAGHPWSSTPWEIDVSRPHLAADLTLHATDDTLITRWRDAGITLVVSALPPAVARELEPHLVEAGFHVLSNASAHRHSPDVPLVIADVNPHHLSPLRLSSLRARTREAVHACATNCTVIPVALPLKPVWDLVGVEEVHVVSMQALSGGGRGTLGDASLRETVVPFIEGEEPKLVRELQQVLGRLGPDGVQPAGFRAHAACHRVPVVDGHLVTVTARLSRPVEDGEVEECMAAYRSRPQTLDLPSAPVQPLVLMDEPDRPRASVDRWVGGGEPDSDPRAGMAVAVGRVALLEPDLLRFTALSHNTVRGAAGGVVLLAELLEAEGLPSNE